MNKKIIKAWRFLLLAGIAYALFSTMRALVVLPKVYGGETLINGFLLGGGLILLAVFLATSGINVLNKLRENK